MFNACNIIDFPEPVSPVITVNPGAVSYVKIRTIPNNGGKEFGDSTITAGTTIDFYAAGYDSDNNFVILKSHPVQFVNFCVE